MEEQRSTIEEAALDEASLATRRRKAMLRKRRKNRPKNRKRSQAAKRAHRKNKSAYKRAEKKAIRTRKTSPLHHWAPLPASHLILQELALQRHQTSPTGSRLMPATQVAETQLSPASSRILLVMGGKSPAEALASSSDCQCPTSGPSAFTDPTKAQPMQDAKATLDRLSNLQALPSAGPGIPNVWPDPDEEAEEDEYDDDDDGEDGDYSEDEDDDDDVEDAEEKLGVDLDGDNEEGEDAEHQRKVRREHAEHMIGLVMKGVTPEQAVMTESDPGFLTALGAAGHSFADAGTNAAFAVADHPYLTAAGALGAVPAINALSARQRRKQEAEDLARMQAMGDVHKTGFGLKAAVGTGAALLATKMASNIARNYDPDVQLGAVKKLKRWVWGASETPMQKLYRGAMAAITPGKKKPKADKGGTDAGSDLGKLALGGAVGAGALYGAHKLISGHLKRKKREAFLAQMQQGAVSHPHPGGAVVLARRMEDKDDPRYGMIVTEAVYAPPAQTSSAGQAALRQPAPHSGAGKAPVHPEIKRQARELAKKDFATMFGGAL